MQRPGFITTEKKPDVAALVVDKVGVIGEVLANKLSQELLVVYVSKELNSSINSSKSLIHVSYNAKFPSIPENAYSYIFVIDDGTRITRESLAKFIEKAEKDNSQLVFVVHIADIREKLISRIIDNPRIAKIIIYGDIFSKNKPYNFTTSQFVVNKFIWEARRFGKIKILGDGLNKTYPVFLDHAIDAILDAVFGYHGLSSIFYLFPKHAPTQISLAHMIQKANPNVAIDFVKTKNKEKEKIILPSKGKYLLADNYKLQERIRKIFLEDSAQLPMDEANGYFEIKKNNYNLLPLFGLLYFIFLLSLPLIATLFFSFLGFKMLTAAKEEVDRGRLINAQRLINSSNTYFSLAKKTATALLIEAKLIGRKSDSESIMRNIGFGEDISRAGLYFIESLNKYSMVFTNQSKNPKDDFILAGTMLKNSMVLLQKMQGEDKLRYTFNAAIKDYDPLIKFVSGSIDILPNIFGFTGEKTYLILFQDNMELRPGGGFIQSYGLLTMDKGAVKNFSTHNVYESDSQLKGHVEPPYPIRRFLPVGHWYLRDSNFDIDFVKSASRSAFFLNLETGKKADGVLSIDASFVRNLIARIGPIYLTNNKQLVDKDNIRAILLDISQRRNFPILSLAKVVSDSLEQKHLLFAFATPSIQDFFTVNNWSSSIWDKRVEQEDTINDFVALNEANLGANKANFFIKRKVSDNITIDNKGRVFGELSILYDNTSSRGLLNGDYKNYLRVILQPDAELSSIFIDNLKQSIVKAITDPEIYESKKFLPPNGLEVDKTQEGKKVVYGFLVNIKAGKRQAITVKYSLSKKVSLSPPLLFYNLRFFKQPGTDGYPFDFSLSFPSFFKPINIPKGAIKKYGLPKGKKGKVYLSKTLNSDYEVVIGLAKQ